VADTKRSLLDDEPLRQPEDDRFRRQPLAERIAVLVENAAARTESTVFAVVGPWGSGKTSLLRFAEQALDPSTVVTVDFNPWLVSSVDGLLGEFFSTLSEAMPKEKPRAKRAKQALLTYGGAATPILGVVPGGAAVAGVVDRAAQLAEPSLAKLRRAAEKALKESKTAYLVVVDDIDRLQPDELLMLFKVIRLVGRLPNVHYLLAFDEQSIIDGLKATSVAVDAGRAMAYLEKIVQVRVDLPELHAADIDALVAETWETVLAPYPGSVSAEDRERFDRMYRRYLRSAIRQPRQVVRLFAQVQHAWPLVKDEVDIVDLVLLTYVRTTWPALYGRLPSMARDLLTTIPQLVQARGMTPEQHKKMWSRLIADSDVAEPQREEALAILCELFPGVAAATKGTGSAQVARRPKSIGTGEYFDRYFQLGIPPDDVPDSMVAACVQALASGADEGAWLAEKLEGHPRLVLDKMMIAAQDLDDGSFASPAVLRFLVANLAAIRSDASAVLDPFVRMIVWLTDAVTSWSPDVRQHELPRLMAMPSGLYCVTNGLRFTAEDEELTEADLAAREEIRTAAMDAADRALVEAVSSPLRDDELPWILSNLAKVRGRSDIALWLTVVLDNTEWTTKDFAACFVSVLRTAGTGLRRLGDLSIAELGELVPIPSILDTLRHEIDAAGSPAPGSERDISHEARVAKALASLKELRDRRFRDVPALDDTPISLCGPSHFSSGSSSAEVVLRAVIAFEPDTDLVGGGAAVPSLIDLEDPIEGIINADPLSSWLSGRASEWGVEDNPVWQVQPSTRSYAELRFGPDPLDTFGARATVGTGNKPNGAAGMLPLMVTVDIGLRLTHLDGERRTDSDDHTRDSPPAPAAVSVGEVASYLTELLEGADRIFTRIAELIGVTGGQMYAGLWIAFDAVEMRRVIDLTGFTLRGNGSSVGEVSQTVLWPMDDFWQQGTAVRLAAAALAEMLERSGYRGFRPTLDALVRDRDGGT
jgi:hypothetical protein